MTRSQSASKLDTLLDVLRHPFENDSLHAIAYEDLIWHYIELSKEEKILAYLDSLRLFGLERNYGYAELLYEFNVAYFYFRQSEYDSARYHMQEVAVLADSLNYPKQKFNALSRLATIAKIRGELDLASSYLQEATSIAVELKIPKLIAQALGQQAGVEYDIGNYMVSLEKYLLVDSLYQEFDDVDPYGRGLVLNNLGILHHEQLSNDEKALQYFTRAKELYAKHGVKHNLATLDLAVARVYFGQHRIKEADSLLTSALDYFRSIDHPLLIAKSSMLLGEVKLQLNQKSVGEELLLGALMKFEELGSTISLVSTHGRLGQFYAENGRLAESRLHFQRALDLHPSGDVRANILRNLANSLRLAGNYKSALDTLDRFVTLSDSLNESELHRSLQEAETKYQSVEKENEIVNLKLIQSVQAVRNQRLLLGSMAGISALLLLTFFYFYRARQKAKLSKQLQDLDELRSKLFSEISHEFRTPLALIKGPVELLTKKLISESALQEDLQIIDRNVDKLSRLVDSVQNLSKLDAGKLDLQIKPVNLNEHLKVITASFESMAIARGLELSLKSEVRDEVYYYDPQLLETILYNLLSNAIKYTSDGTVTLFASVKNHLALVEVQDTGIGLTEEEQAHIFKRYYRVRNAEYAADGLGIGLALAYELAKLHFGTLSVSSEHHKGSVFSLELPVYKNLYVERGVDIGKTFLPEGVRKSIGNKVPEFPGSIDPDEPVLLLVEDNPDMRLHLKAVFKDEYSIVVAENGLEGVEMANKYIPDLIISDLMMPEMNGMDFLKSVKTDYKTSHIPFIMLTANHLEEEKMKGLRHRVDDYMTKPFSIDELRAKVENLIQLREQLRLKYETRSSMDIPGIELANETEQFFWKRIHEVVEENLDNADFSADDFANAMLMSRMQLHRKIKALTNLSTSIFVRTERLKSAKELLRKPDAIIANVAYDVGFTSPSFFSKCFKEQYGTSPRAYMSGEPIPKSFK